MNSSIKKIPRSMDKSLMITKVFYETLQEKETLIVTAALFPTPCVCGNCGFTVVDGDGKLMVMKSKRKETIVHFE